MLELTKRAISVKHSTPEANAGLATATVKPPLAEAKEAETSGKIRAAPLTGKLAKTAAELPVRGRETHRGKGYPFTKHATLDAKSSKPSSSYATSNYTSLPTHDRQERPKSFS